MEAMIRQNLNAVSFKYDAQPPHAPLIEYAINVNVPMSTAVRLGEACYNLRCALDYFIFALARLDSGSEQPRSQFPIEDTAKDFAYRQRRGWLNGINRAHVAMIEALQPYRGCEWSAALRDMSNVDKHRSFVDLRCIHAIRFYEPGDPDYDLLRLPKYRAHHPIRGEVEVKLDIALSITLADQATRVMETLEKIKAGIRQTLTDFKPEF